MITGSVRRKGAVIGVFGSVMKVQRMSWKPAEIFSRGHDPVSKLSWHPGYGQAERRK